MTAPDYGRFSFASVGMSDWKLDAVEPVSGQMGDLLAQAGGEPDVLIYVHGFRQTFEGSVLDAARLSDGIKFRGATMVFSWPSKAGFFDYAYDRESAVWSRDAFERAARRDANRTPAACTSSPTAWAPCWRWKACARSMARYGDSAASDRRRRVRFAGHRPRHLRVVDRALGRSRTRSR